MTQLNESPETKSPDAPPPDAMQKASSTKTPNARPASIIRLRWAVGIMAVLVIIAFIGWWNLPPQLHGIQLQSPRVADDFTLIASNGEKLSLSDLRGKYVVLFFGYTYCPDVCPTTMNEMQQMVKALGPQRTENLQVVMVSVDPERDTPKQLATYVNYFDPNFIGLTGTVEDVQPVASQFGIYFEKQAGSENTSYLVDHTSAVTVIDPEGYVRMIFTYGVPGADMASDIAYLMRRG